MNDGAIDQGVLREKQALIGQIGAWASVAAVTFLGLRLGLYGALGDGAAATAASLAAKTGYNERLLLEWLRCQCAAGLIQHEGNETFRLLPEVALLLADDTTLAFAGAPFLAQPVRMQSLGLLEKAFKTGLGYGWDDAGPDIVAATERARRAWFSQVLIPDVLPRYEGMVDKLTAGAQVADVGCGSGIAIIEMAKQYPASTFHGYEVSTLSLQRAEENRRTAGLSNIQLHDATKSPLPDGVFDLVMTLDCLHDMTQPERVAADIRRTIKPDGTWFIMDFDCEASFEGNLQRGSVFAASAYATSMMVCLPSSMAEEGALGFGTLGLPEPALREIGHNAGFGRFRRVKTDGRWALFEVRV